MRWICFLVLVVSKAAHCAEFTFESGGRIVPYQTMENVAAERDRHIDPSNGPFAAMGFRLVPRRLDHQAVPVIFPQSQGIGILTNRVLVGAGQAFVKKLPLGEKVVRVVSLTPRISLVYTTTVEEAVRLSQSLTKVNGVRFAHPAFHFPIEARNNFDPLVSQQWHLRNTGQRGGSVGSDIKAIEAWNLSRGNPDTLVALIDLGFEQDHPDLAGSWYQNQGEIPGNKVDDDGNGLVDDVRGWNFDTNSNNLLYGSANSHGTATAGLIAARENGIGITGVCPECRILPMVIYTDVVDAIAAFQYAADHGARVVSNSWGYRIGTPTTAALEEVLTELGKTMSILFAMPNFGSDACRGSSPDISAHPAVIAVSSVDYNDIKVANAGYGACLQLVGPTSGSQVNGVVTTDRVGDRGYNRSGVPYPDLRDQDYTQSFYGTSAATPIVAGVFALLYAQFPDWTPDQVKNRVIHTADKINATDAGYNEQGHSLKYGYGRPNAYRALLGQ